MRSLLLVLVFQFVVVLTTDPSCLTLNKLIYRTYDGSCNNLFDSSVGQAGGFYSRSPAGAEFADGISTPVTNRPNERLVSNTVCKADPSTDDPIPHSLFATQFGQFVNHDLDNNRLVDAGNPNVFPVTISFENTDDFCFLWTTPGRNLTLFNACLPPFNQTGVISLKASAGNIVDGVFQIRNNATAWLDLSQIYAPSDEWNSLIRTHQGGLLSTSDYINFNQTNTFRFTGTFAPFLLTLRNGPPSFASTHAPVDSGLFIVPGLADPNKIFTSGDERVGENPALSLFHTLFIREHNRIALELAASHPDWDDAKLFEEARRLNVAYYQNIVLYQYLPIEFGQYFFEKYVGDYEGYELDDQVATPIEFASAAFRYGHSSFRNYVPFDECGNPTLLGQPAQGNKLLFGGQTGGQNFPLNIVAEAGSYENLIRGLIGTHTQPNDVNLEDTVRNIPFRTPRPGGTDLMVLDLTRARINGVPNYNALRKVYYPEKKKNNIYGMRGCPKHLENRPNDVDDLGCFLILAGGNSTLAQSLRILYKKVNRVDAMLGLLAEPHVPGTSFGHTLGAIIVKTYANARNGDRFWFENRFQPNAFSREEIEDIKDTTIEDLLNRNFDLVAPVPNNPFYVHQFHC